MNFVLVPKFLLRKRLSSKCSKIYIWFYDIYLFRIDFKKSDKDYFNKIFIINV